MPHITEEIWHTLTQNSDDSLALQSLPVVDELIGLTTVEKVSSPSLISFENTEEGTIVKLGHQVVSLLDQLPNQISGFIQKYQQSFTIGAIALLSLIVIQLISSITTAIHDFPLLSPFLRLIGLGYTGWFVYQNFIFVDKRQETLQWLANFKQEIFGNIQKTDSLIKRETEETPLVITPTFTTLIDEELETSFSLLFETIRAIRNLRAEAEIKPGVKVNAILQSENPEEREILQQTQNYIMELAKVENLTITDSLTDEVSKAGAQRAVGIASVVGTIQILIPLEGIIDIEKLTAKLEKKLSKIEGEIKSLEARLNNPNFVNKAPNDVIENARNALAESKIQGEILQKRLELLK